MDIFRGFKIFQVFLVTCVCLVFLTIFSSQIYCKDNWVYVGSNKHFTQYYNSLSININKQNKIIKVWVKHVFTEMGKDELIKDFDNIGKQKFKEIEYDLTLYLFDYKQGKYTKTHTTVFSKSGNLLDDYESPPEWIDIIPDSILESMVNKLLIDYNLQR